jgi:hypothetical protein
MSTAEPVDRERIAGDFRTQMEGKLDPAQIEAGAATIASAGQSYPATAMIDSFGTLRVQVQGGKTFRARIVIDFSQGRAEGLVFTNDIERLYRETVSFQFAFTPASVSVVFFDGANTVLGTFQGGPAPFFSGVGGGGGSWS